MSSPTTSNVQQYVRALERALRILGFDPAEIEVYGDGALTKECIASLEAIDPLPAALLAAAGHLRQRAAEESQDSVAVRNLGIAARNCEAEAARLRSGPWPSTV
jgi:hypothetical protein